MAGSPPNFHKMDSRSACIQGVLKVKVKVKGHVIRALSWILGMSYSVIDGLVFDSIWFDSIWFCLIMIRLMITRKSSLRLCSAVCLHQSTWRHPSHDQSTRHRPFPMVVHWNRASISYRSRYILTPTHVNKWTHLQSQTNKHDGSQYLLVTVEVINVMVLLCCGAEV